MTGHHGLPADVDDQLDGRELHGGRPRVEEGLVLTWVAKLLQRNYSRKKLFAASNSCSSSLGMASRQQNMGIGWLPTTLNPPPARVHTRQNTEGITYDG